MKRFKSETKGIEKSSEKIPFHIPQKSYSSGLFFPEFSNYVQLLDKTLTDVRAEP